MLEILSPDQWGKMADASTTGLPTDPMADTALRRVKLGSVLRYGFEIYNAKLGASKQPDVATQVRVFRDGKLVLDGKPTPLDLRVQTSMRQLRSAGAVSIGNKMAAGDYVLQVIVTDKLGNPKQQVTSQFVQFEVVE